VLYFVDIFSLVNQYFVRSHQTFSNLKAKAVITEVRRALASIFPLN